MLTNNVDPQKGGEANFTSVWKDLAHCANRPREEVACDATFTRITSECTCSELENNSSAMATVTQNRKSNQIEVKL